MYANPDLYTELSLCLRSILNSLEKWCIKDECVGCLGLCAGQPLMYHAWMAKFVLAC